MFLLTPLNIECRVLHLRQVPEMQIDVGAVTYHQYNSMVSNETVLMCGEASVTNAPLCIHQSTQIINQLDGQF